MNEKSSGLQTSRALPMESPIPTDQTDCQHDRSPYPPLLVARLLDSFFEDGAEKFTRKGMDSRHREWSGGDLV